MWHLALPQGSIPFISRSTFTCNRRNLSYIFNLNAVDFPQITKYAGKTQTDQNHGAFKRNVIAQEIQSDKGVTQPTKHEGITQTDQRHGAS